MSDQPPDDWQDIDAEWDDADLQRTPVKSPPALAAERDHAQDPGPADEDSFEEDADTVFEGDQPTVDYLVTEVPDHVAEFLDEGSGGPAVPDEVIVPLPAAGPQQAATSEPLFEPGSDPAPGPAPGDAAEPVAPLFEPGSDPAPGPAPGAPLVTAAPPRPEIDDASLDTLPTRTRAITVLLVIGLLLAIAGLVYISLYL
jgi:hypothetical protein